MYNLFMKKWLVTSIVISIAFVVIANGWYFIIRPSDIKKSCNTKTSHLQNTESSVDTNKIADAIDAPTQYDRDIALNAVEYSKKTYFTGERDTAYNACLREHGI